MCQCEIYETCPECRGTDRDMGLVVREKDELDDLRREMDLNSLGDRPHSMAASKLQRLIELERKYA